MKWIKSWSKIDDAKSYLVMARHAGEELRLYDPMFLYGWQLKRLREGVYLATEFFKPSSLDECE